MRFVSLSHSVIVISEDIVLRSTRMLHERVSRLYMHTPIHVPMFIKSDLPSIAENEL